MSHAPYVPANTVTSHHYAMAMWLSHHWKADRVLSISNIALNCRQVFSVQNNLILRNNHLKCLNQTELGLGYRYQNYLGPFEYIR